MTAKELIKLLEACSQDKPVQMWDGMDLRDCDVKTVLEEQGAIVLNSE